MDAEQTHKTLSQKLKEKLKGKKLIRSGESNQRAFLQKKKVPTELVDSYLNALKNPNAPNIMPMLDQMTKMLPQGPVMQPPTVPSELKNDKSKNDKSKNEEPSFTIESEMPEIMGALQPSFSIEP
jgi:hypothetical protein